MFDEQPQLTQHHGLDASSLAPFAQVDGFKIALHWTARWGAMTLPLSLQPPPPQRRGRHRRRRRRLRRCQTAALNDSMMLVAPAHALPTTCAASLFMHRLPAAHWVRCRMEEAYEEALQRLGGLAEARPRQVLEELAPEFPQLTSKVR